MTEIREGVVTKYMTALEIPPETTRHGVKLTTTLAVEFDEWKAAIEDAGYVIVPREPTEEMHDAARDWSIKKYGKGIGRDASEGCYIAMITAHKGES